MSKKPALMPKAERREGALKIAVKLARKVGARRVSMAMVAAAQGVTAPLLFHIFESRAGLVKAIVKEAKKLGIVLPEGAPTVREARAARKPALKPMKMTRAALAALKGDMSAKEGIKRVAKLRKNAAPAKKPVTQKRIPAPITTARKKVKALGAALKAGRKPLTDAQREAKRARDKARRAQPLTPAEKFAALPTPFAASLAQA